MGDTEQSGIASLRAATQMGYAWLQPFAPAINRMLRCGSNCAADILNQLRSSDAPVAFVPQGELPNGEAYEAFIARTGRVPTRENLHDLLNGLIWLTLPRLKRRMNALQAHEIAKHGVGSVRGRVRDALTVFDENGAVLCAPTGLRDALKRRDWHGLFVEHRSLWSSARLMLVGHALLEKLMQPRKNITAHVWLVDDLSDDALAASLTADEFTSKSLLPLPVLGVPGWWPENEVPQFYDDAGVFRPARQ